MPRFLAVAHTQLPATDGHETFGARPALIIEVLNPHLTIIAPFTTNLDALRFPFTMRIDSTRVNGLDRPSILMLYQLRTLDNRRIGAKVGKINRDLVRAVEVDLMSMFSLYYTRPL